MSATVWNNNGGCILYSYLSPFLYLVWETSEEQLENCLAVKMGGRQKVGVDKFHAPTDKGGEI